jgi:hypothetical protein
MSLGINLSDPLSVSIGINPFFRESAKVALYPEWFSFETIIEKVAEAMDKGNYKRGYRDGVLLVSLDPKGWKTRVVTLREGDRLEGSFKSRVFGELPRKQTGVVVKSIADLPDAQSVEVVLYSNETLAEKDEPRTGKEFDIITVLVHPVKGGAPMSPGTLMANHFGASGGTATNMSPEQFETSLRESFRFWSDKAIAEVQNV